MSNNDNKSNAQDIFAKQIEALKLEEEQKEIAKKRIFGDIDLSIFDLEDFEDEFDDEFEEESDDILVGLDDFTLSEIVDICESFGDDEEYGEDYINAIIKSTNQVVSAIESNKMDIDSIDLNEKLLAIAKDEYLWNAITYMGLQLSEVCGNKMRLVGTHGKYLEYAEVLANMLDNWKNFDVDTQTTLICDMHIIKEEVSLLSSVLPLINSITNRLKYNEQHKLKWAGQLDLEDISDRAYEFVSNYYNYMSDSFADVYKRINDFYTGYQNGGIVLKNSGNYNPSLSLSKKAKRDAFGFESYPIIGDEEREFYWQDIETDESMTDFLENQSRNENKRNIMAKAYFMKLKSKHLYGDKMVDYCEKLLHLDEKNYYTHIIEKYKNDYAEIIAQKKYQGYIGEKVINARIKKNSAETQRGYLPKLPGIIGGIACLVLAIVALLIPLVTLNMIIENALKLVLIILLIVGFLATGPAILIVAPLFMVCVQFIFGFVDVFMNPVLAIKLLLVLSFGGLAYALLFANRHHWKVMKEYIQKAQDEKAIALPLAQDVLAKAKKANLPSEILKYYENMVNDLNSIE